VINFVDSPPNSEESWTGKTMPQSASSPHLILTLSSPPTSNDLVESSSLIEQITIVVDAQSKDSPGPQIIDVQTIYLNSGSRKRRMDWDSLDIVQSENSPTASQSGELPTKVAHQEKDKHKREKHSGKDSINPSCTLNNYKRNPFSHTYDAFLESKHYNITLFITNLCYKLNS